MMFLKQAIRRSCVLAAGLLGLTSNAPSHAGSPRFFIEFTNMTPNEFSDQAAKQCSNQLKARLSTVLDNASEGADTKTSNTTYIDEAERRKRVSANGGDMTNFMAWGSKEIPLDDFTFAIAVDCRPDKQRLDVLLVGHKGSVTFRLRNEPLSSKRLNWLAEDIVTRSVAMAWR
jgi:hypothetical protein